MRYNGFIKKSMEKLKERAPMELNLDRRSAGQWMTDGDPFYMPVFAEWLDDVYSKIGKKRISACEPYAGKLGLVAHLRARGLDDGRIDWSAYDIAPQDELLADGIEIGKANTLRSIPSSPYNLIVTNPPYLARNSARRRGLPFPFDERGRGIEKPADLYQFALDTCLESASYCAMLIPESFITCRYDKSRCDAILSLRGGLFEDTDCPVCLALFSPHGREGGPLIYSNGGKLLGALDGIRRESERLIGDKANPIKMNDPDGDCSLIAIDSTAGRSIRFAGREAVRREDVKVSSRALTRCSRADGKPITAGIIDEANRILEAWRDETADVLMTPFKGVRKDGLYRRRLAFAEAKGILSTAIGNIEGNIG